MKWNNHFMSVKSAMDKKRPLVGIKRKKFAFTPVEVKEGYVVWLQHYYAVYVEEGYCQKFSASEITGKVIREDYYAS